MTLTAGTKLGPYEITGAIGAGGMGEVYRARDAKLGRDVALKVLPEAFARDAERMARFQREAKVLASLDHPNIASIYGLEDSSSTHALVMQLIEGPTLADRIKQGPISVDESLRIAKQIAEALEYAHERGIVHRDLKPANVKVTADDAVKILDFGLAKALEGDAASMDISTSPTISRLATMQGVLLGTAAYMSPEQAKGKSVDRRADIWAFGCVLYEMLTGQQTFTGEAVTDTLASVIKEEPDWSQLPAGTPIRVRVLLQRCLQKDPKQRLQAIGDARISLDEVLSGAPDPALAGAPQAATPLWRRALPWAIAGLLFVALVSVAFIHFREKPPAPAEPVRFDISPPGRGTIGVFELSPDGRQLAFAAAGSDGVPSVWIRSLDSTQPRRLSGSESTQLTTFFWSPDSRYVAFGDGGKLRKIDVSGGAAETLCEINGAVLGGSWNHDGVIIFGTNYTGLMRVSANGGPASPLTTLDSSRGEVLHDFPEFLPDGRHFIYLRASNELDSNGVYVDSLNAKPGEQGSKRLLSTLSDAIYVPSSDASAGQLLFIRDGALMAQPFDAQRLELSGEPATVASHIDTFRNHGFFSASTNGVLVYSTGSVARTFQPTWFDRQGKVLGTVGEPGDFASLSISPDGKGAAVSRIDSGIALWLLDFSRGTSERFTFGSAGAADGIWSPDSSRIIFGYYRSGVSDLYQKPASGATDEELLLKSSENKIPTSWSRDGRFLLYAVQNRKTAKGELWILPLVGDKKPHPFLRNEFNNDFGRFSPNGRLVAYQSDESGRNEIYVRTFTPDSPTAASDTGGKWLISTDGGSEPRWGEDGKELYFLGAGGTLLSVEIATSPVFQAGVPKPLFRTPLPPRSAVRESWDLTPDGKRFLLLAPGGPTGEVPLTVVLNWQAGLKQ
jgi:eukaryotic-like serine/threonine-protein kinase